MTMDLQHIDLRLSVIARKLNFYSYLTPLNQQEERERFFGYLDKGKEYNPVFAYRTGEFSDIKKELENIRGCLDKTDNMEKLFFDKADFILKQIELLECDDNAFSEASVNLFGKPDRECLDEAENMLSSGKEEGYIFPEETVTPEEMLAIMKKCLEQKKIRWNCAISTKIIPKITISGKDRTMYINGGIKYTREEVDRLKVHEIDVHVLRGVNGSMQPFRIFVEGLAGYDETEEGLAIRAEEICGCLKTDTRQMKLYAGRALCVDLCMKGSFFDAFTELRDYFPEDIAYRLVERMKRGMKDTSLKGSVTKGFHYISGWQKTEKYIEQGGDLSILYVGKIGLDDVECVRELLDSGELNPPEYLPEFIKKAKGERR